MLTNVKNAAMSSPSPGTGRDSDDKPAGSLGKLYQKLSRRRLEKRDPDAPNYHGLQRVFRYLDEDGDGKLSAAQLQNCVRMAGGELSVEEAREVVDSDGDGVLDFGDFVRLMDVKGDEEERNKELREAFGMYEMEGSGCITPKSLRRMLARLGLGESTSIHDCKAMIRRFDLDGDGVLSFHEFSIMMN